MNPLLKAILARAVKVGSIKVIAPNGRQYRFGDESDPKVCVRITSRWTEWRLIFDPELSLGESYMDQTFIIEKGDIYAFLELVYQETTEPYPWFVKKLTRFRFLFRRFRQNNTLRRARRNVAHHYDLDRKLYDLFLDNDRQYSCAYFEDPDQSLEQAQKAKLRHLAAKLQIEDGHRVLDIGSGWGGLGLYLANHLDVSVTGVTLSQEQHDLSTQRALDMGLSDRVDFRIQDYRTLEESFDRIVSVGMFEHVGIGHFKEFFDHCRRLLTDRGVMVLHSIGRFAEPGVTNPWINRYIFPGGYIPSLSEVLAVLERSGLKITDVEILRLHYAETLKHWRHRFHEHWDEAAAVYDQRFCRMWDFYLAGSEAAFREQDLMVFQIQLAKHQEAVPLTRDYIGEMEAQLRTKERQQSGLRIAGE